MANAGQYFIVPNESNDVILSKLARFNRVELAEDGSVAVSDTSAHVPDLGVVAWGLIKATSATVVASLTSFDPVTLVSSVITPTLASGEVIRGFFTAITLTSGSVACNNIKSTEAAPVPGIRNVTVTPNVSDDTKLDYNFDIYRAAGAHPPGSTEIWRKVDAGAYALLHTTSDDNGRFSYSDLAAQTGATEVIKYKVRYADGSSKGAYSNEITPTPDLPVVTLGSGTWTHSTLTAAMVITVPAGGLAADSIEVWGYADGTALTANGALTLLSTVHPSVDGATTVNFSKAYAGFDDSADSIHAKFQVRYKRGSVYGLRSAVLSILTTDA